MSHRCRWLWLASIPFLCKGLNYNHRHSIHDSNAPTFDNVHRQTQTRATTYDTIKDRSCYRSIEGMNQSMKDLADKYPLLITMEAIGESHIKKYGAKASNNIINIFPPGYDIYAFNVTNANSTRQSSQKAKLLLTSGIHAREYTPTELVGRFIEMLIDGYNNRNAQITTILQHTEIHAVIHVNPDGRYMAEQNPNTYWRKNMNPSGGCDKSIYYGVDINRNFDFLWGDASGASDDPCSDEYHGSEPNSEVETQALVDYAMRVFPESQRRSDPEDRLEEPLGENVMGMYVDIHSFGNFIYYPWGHRDKQSPDDDAFQAIARKMSYYNGYGLWASGYDFLYPASGDSSDYFYAVMGVASLGFELGSDFYEDCNVFENDILPMNLDVLLYAASIASRPFSLAKGPDVMDVVVDDGNGDGEIVVTAQVSDGVMVNSLKGESDHQTGNQNIAKVVLYLNVHPDDFEDGDLTWEMSAVDGEFDSSEETVEVTLSTKELSSGAHTLHVQAIDFDGYLGPVKSVSIEVEKEDTNSPSKYASTAPLAMTISPSPKPNTSPPTLANAQPSGVVDLTPNSPSLNPSNDTRTTSPTNVSESQSPSIATQAPTALPKMTSSPTPTPTDLSTTAVLSPLSSNTPTDDLTSTIIPTTYPNSLPITSLQPTTSGDVDTFSPTNSSSTVSSLSLRLILTTCAFWILYQLS